MLRLVAGIRIFLIYIAVNAAAIWRFTKKTVRGVCLGFISTGYSSRSHCLISSIFITEKRFYRICVALSAKHSLEYRRFTNLKVGWHSALFTDPFSRRRVMGYIRLSKRVAVWKYHITARRCLLCV